LAGETDLVVDDVRDRALLEAVGAGLRERVVEVRADAAGGADRRQRVTTGALLLEEGLSVLDVGGRRDLAARAAGGQGERDRCSAQRGCEEPQLTQEAGRPP
jgi:hypothetical protein